MDLRATRAVRRASSGLVDTVMKALPEDLAQEYRVATLYEIRSWSFGQLKAVREPLAQTWLQTKGTLDDDSIFGPRQDYECACGKYRGAKYEGMICHLCGVKIAAREIRRIRFAHIELAYPIPHPLVTPVSALDAIPVLPAGFWESSPDGRLAVGYDDVLCANGMRDPRRLIETVGRAFDMLLPLFVVAHEWNPQDAAVLARGLALVPRSEDADDLHALRQA
jgi:hypothetical protein